MSKEKECKAEVNRLMELFEEQYPESPGYLYDDIPYMLALGAIVIHRAGCELSGEPEKYKPLEQLKELGLLPGMREGIEVFILRNRMDDAGSYSLFAPKH